jgi:ribonuclease HII
MAPTSTKRPAPPAKRKLRAVTKATAKQQMLRQLICTDAPEQALRHHGFCVIAGVDEVGRGALFGPVVAAAVILPEEMSCLAKAGLKDSKQLLREQREELDQQIRAMALAFSVAEVDSETIDRVNIYQATRLAMLAAVEGLGMMPDHLLIDAMRIDHPCRQTKLIYGDSLSLSIAAASVIAKVHRDALMRALDELHPGYGLASHKGYGTPAHRRALQEHGPSALHRRSFAPVRGVEVDIEDLVSQELLFEDTDLEEADWA